MINKIVKELENKINVAKKNGKCVIDLEMKKKVIDTQDNGLNDILAINFPTSIDKEFGRVYYRVSEYSEDSFRRFNNLEDIAEWIIKTYC